jgi:hypothetical protein
MNSAMLFLPSTDLIPVATWNPVFGAFLLAGNQPKSEAVASRITGLGQQTAGTSMQLSFEIDGSLPQLARHADTAVTAS